MKKSLAISIFVLVLNVITFAQSTSSDDTIEEIIRHLELMETQAVVAQDLDVLNRIWAEDFMVNNPSNTVINGKSQVLERVESGIIHYSSFERNIESMKVLGDIVIVMGQETIMPVGKAPGAGKIVNRRYTNIWMLDEGEWRVKARHANIIREE